MSIQRLIEFTTDEAGASATAQAVREAFAALGRHQPDGVKLAYWAVEGEDRFLALIELEDSAHNPLLAIQETAELPQVIGRHVEGGGYPTPRVVELMGAYGFTL